MALKKYKPVTPGRRFATGADFSEITKSKPERSLVGRRKQNAGRNSAGRITVRRRGGGHKRLYRFVDFRRVKQGVPAKVAAIEYDPNRSANLALLHYVDGEKAYILAPAGLTVGATVTRGRRRSRCPAMLCRWNGFRWGRSFTTSSWSRRAARGWRARRAPGHN